MTTYPMTPAAARTILDAVIRKQLRETWQRGMDTAPQGVNALADNGAPAAFDAIAAAADNYAAAIAADRAPFPDPGRATVAEEGDVVIVHCADTLQLAPGTGLRAIPCLACREPIGGKPFTVFGVAGLAGMPCRNDGIASDVFLIHAEHWPMDYADLQAVIERGLQCGADH